VPVGPVVPDPAPLTHAAFALPDHAVSHGLPVRIAVLANDGAPGLTLDPKTTRIVEHAQHGAPRVHGEPGLVSKSAGTILYVPAPKFVGTDSLSYRVCTTTGVCETAVVTVTVTSRLQ
jgi:hypothetical protein